MADSQLVVFGDSVEWGQGLLDGQKFSSQLAKRLSLTVNMQAHSGATIGIGDAHAGRCGPEVPLHYPTVVQQVQGFQGDPASVSWILVNGGINDISIEVILNPLTHDDRLRFLIQKHCHDDMLALLKMILARFNNPATRIVVTGYFPIFSSKSDLAKILPFLSAISIAVPPQLADELSQRFARESVDNAMIFWKESRTQLQAAVADLQSSRVVFVDAPFTEDNSMFTDSSWLFNVHFMIDPFGLQPEDAVAADRRKACVQCHPLDPFAQAVCFIASAGHPNPTGANAYFTAIAGALGMP
jgi:lysophospholipase L1-like esterase